VRTLLGRDPDLTKDDRSRQSLFLAFLNAQPSLSWVAFGGVDRSFLAVHRISDSEIYQIAIKPPLPGGWAEQRIERYELEDGTLVLKESAASRVQFNASAQSWFRHAVASGDMVSEVVPDLPANDRLALCFAAPLQSGYRPLGVVLVAIDMDRLRKFLDGLPVGKSGQVVVLSKEGEVVAAADGAMGDPSATGKLVGLDRMGSSSTLLKVLQLQLESKNPVLSELTDPREVQISPPGEKDTYFINFSSLSFEGWIVATIIPGSDFLSQIDENARILGLALVVLTIAMGLAAISLADRLFSLPLLRVSDQLRFIKSFELGALRRISSPLRELDNLSAALMQMASGLASFQKYMPTTLVRTLVSQGIEAKPGGQEKELTVLFTDIAGFTGLSERLGGDIVPILTDYLNLASTAILASDGTIDKFIGDAVMAFWGAPIDNSRHASQACATALDLQARLAVQRPIWREAGKPALAVRIGINTGRMLVGNIGSNERLSYTVIGDSVNIASRLESLNKQYGTEIIIGEDTRNAALNDIVVRRLDFVSVYGRTQGIAIFELLAMKLADESPPRWVGLYESALEAYSRRDWGNAILLFTQASQERGGDQPSELFVARCKALLAKPPGADWTPLVSLESK
jgi:adenylate cyclase